ncbi:hypothetical protein GZ78_21275 [Endozoicomonas numazuensis]|uniref:Flagellar assembly protein T N-terminal domain-containing protein n=2 Tax=Endozoicomonas numazuensis TaxID=1137799 RepID=A0A081ND80_9GAMM|nr:hypothetical protein GZ78_21275 [Endozoicomonas numazuensis]
MLKMRSGGKESMINRFLSLLVGVLMLPVIAQASLDSRVEEMLESDQLLSMYEDNTLGRTVIAIGLGMNRSASVAQEMSRQDALKTLTTFLKGERLTAVDRAEQGWKGNQVLEAYYSSITTEVEGSLKSVWTFRIGELDGMTYTVLVISENSRNYTEEMDDQNNTVKAQGVASLSSGVDVARTTALNNALRNAVEQYGGVQLAAKTTIENAEKYQGKLSTVSSGHVSRYKIEVETQDSDNYYVTIVAEISDSVPKGEENFSVVKEGLGRPTFAIESGHIEVARSIRELFSEQGLDVVSDSETARYRVKADVQTHEYDAMAGMKGMRTTIRVRIHDRFSNEDLLYIISDPDKSVEISDSAVLRQRNSLNYAIDDIEGELTGSIRKAFVDQFNNGSKVTVTLKNFDRMRDVDELLACIESLPLTRSVTVSPIQKRDVTYDVIYLGDPSGLQLDILKQAQSYRLQGLKVKSTKDGTIQMTF